MNRTLMAVAAHADDIEFNAAGTLLKYRDAGYEIVYVMSTNNMSGAVSEPGGNGRPVVVDRLGPSKTMALRKAEAEEAAKVFGAAPIHLDHPQRHYNGPDWECIELRYGCDLPECVPPHAPTILTAHEAESCRKVVVDMVLDLDPEWIITHSMANVDLEHCGTSLLVTKSYWEAVEEGYKGGLLHWREGHLILGETNTRYDFHVDIGGYLDRKMAVSGIHRSQNPMPDRPDHPVRDRALERGERHGCEAAEVFMIVNRGEAGLLE